MASIMAIDLYIASGSPPSWRIWLSLEHKQLPYQLHVLSFQAGDPKKPDYLAINPRGPDSSFDPSEPGQRKKVHRGGSFLCTDQYCSRYIVGMRARGEVTTGTSHLGFRCVRDGTPIATATAVDTNTSTTCCVSSVSSSPECDCQKRIRDMRPKTDERARRSSAQAFQECRRR